MCHLGTWLSGGLSWVNAGLDPKGLFQPKWFYDSKNWTWNSLSNNLPTTFPHLLNQKLVAQVPLASGGPAHSISHFITLPSFTLFLLQAISSKSLLPVLLSSSKCHPLVLQHISTQLFLSNHLISSQCQNHCPTHVISLCNWSPGPPSTAFLTQHG